MTTNYHTPLSAADLLTLLVSLNGRFSDLDSGITGILTTVGSNIEATAGEGLGIRDTAFIDPDDGEIYLMDADSSTPKAGAMRGFVNGTVLVTETATLVVAGVLTGFSGLTIGAPVYVSTTAGGYTQTRPAPTVGGAQVAIMEMGIALTATSILVRPLPIIYEKRDAMADDDTLTINHHADGRGYVRDPRAYITEPEAGATLEEYTSGNQDSDVELRGPTAAGGSIDTNGTGSTAILGDNGSAEIWIAQSFIAAEGILSQIQVTFDANTGSPSGNCTWKIMEDNSGDPTGTQLATGTFTITPSANNTINVAGGPYMDGSSTYWLRLEVPAQSSGVRWNAVRGAATTYADGQRSISNDGGSSWLPQTDDLDVVIVTDAIVAKDKIAQTIAIGASEAIGSVDLYFKKVGSPTGTATVRVETVDGSNDPTGTLAHANATVTFDEADLSTSYGVVTVNFTEFTPGAATYAIVVSTDRAASETDYIVWGADGSAPSYAGGEMKSESSSSWSDESKDAIFAVKAPGILHPSKVNVDWWSSTLAEMVNRYGDGAGTDLETKTTFKCIRSAGFDDVSVQVVLP